MLLIIDGQSQSLTTLKTFRARFGLPENFGCAYFSAKDWAVGSLDSGRPALANVKQEVIQAIPQFITLQELMIQPEIIATVFRESLEKANIYIGLNEEQLDFSVDGLQNVLMTTVYDLARLHQIHRGNVERIRHVFDFSALYQDWLNQSVSVFENAYEYQYANQSFEIKVISYVFGRVGLRIEVAKEIYYVYDPTLACPAAGYMGDLCGMVAQALCAALIRSDESELS